MSDLQFTCSASICGKSHPTQKDAHCCELNHITLMWNDAFDKGDLQSLHYLSIAQDELRKLIGLDPLPERI